MSRRRVLLVLLGSQMLMGCHSWRQSSLGPRALLDEEQPSSVRVTFQDGRVTTMRYPRMVGDSIVGTGDSGTEMAAAEQVRTLEVRRTSVTRSLALTLSNLSVIITAIALIIEVQPHYRGF